MNASSQDARFAARMRAKAAERDAKIGPPKCTRCVALALPGKFMCAMHNDIRENMVAAWKADKTIVQWERIEKYDAGK